MKAKLALAVLGAGYSRRFGKEDKLLASLHGKPVGQHLLGALENFSFTQKILLCRENSLWTAPYAQAGFELIQNNNPEGGMLSSLRKAVLSASPNITHLFICLADMPFISSTHLQKLLQKFEETKGEIPLATQSDSKTDPYKGPPAIFALNDLNTLPDRGEGGARPLLKEALFIPCPVSELKDIDLKNDL
ncbi:nucleotidyltransferase family protein [Acetobacteraceae bacterium]|nr:nucleotidyltransferase family protein [Acetobacteraceae bacterium]